MQYSIEDLQVALDDAAIVFTADPDRVALMVGESELMTETLSNMVETLLDLMDTPEERDEMLWMASHFDSLSRRIKRAVSAVEAESH